MPVKKVSLSLDSELVAKAKQVAGRRGLSALVNDALRMKLQQERIRALLLEMDAEFGPVPAQEMERARRTWPDPPAEEGKRQGRSRRSG